MSLTVRGFLRLSVAAAVATIGLKMLAWWLTGSVGLLSDALESFVNLAGATFALAMVSVAQRPADDDHPYGHHKAEYFSSGFEGVLILGAAVAIIVAAVDRLRHPAPLEALGLGLAVSVMASAINAILSIAMRRAAAHHRSIALEADARHLMTDVWTSAGVVAGLMAVWATGWLWLDPVLAIGVALNIVREALHLIRRSVEGLMDHALEPQAQAAIAKVLDDYRSPDVTIDHVVSRRAGQRSFVDLHLHAPAQWTLSRAANLRTAVAHALEAAVPGLRASVQLLPHGDDAPELGQEPQP